MALKPSSRKPADSTDDLSIAVIIKDSAWLKAVPPLKELAAEVVREAVTLVPQWTAWGFPSGRPVEVSLCFADDAFVKALNAEFRGQDKATNVLSFPGIVPEDIDGGGEILLGDIVLAFGVVAKEAEEQKKQIGNHTVHLILHGLLHLFGYGHEEADEAREMEKLEIKILKRFGIANPYV